VRASDYAHGYKRCASPPGETGDATTPWLPAIQGVRGMYLAAFLEIQIIWMASTRRSPNPTANHMPARFWCCLEYSTGVGDFF